MFQLDILCQIKYAHPPVFPLFLPADVPQWRWCCTSSCLTSAFCCLSGSLHILSEVFLSSPAWELGPCLRREGGGGLSHLWSTLSFRWRMTHWRQEGRTHACLWSDRQEVKWRPLTKICSSCWVVDISCFWLGVMEAVKDVRCPPVADCESFVFAQLPSIFTFFSWRMRQIQEVPPYFQWKSSKCLFR